MTPDPATVAPHLPVRLARSGAIALLRRPANDNHAAPRRLSELRATLEHFAQHGLGAAAEAARQAEAAWRAGDAASRDHWIEVCRALDPRGAARLEARLK